MILQQVNIHWKIVYHLTFPKKVRNYFLRPKIINVAITIYYVSLYTTVMLLFVRLKEFVLFPNNFINFN